MKFHVNDSRTKGAFVSPKGTIVIEKHDGKVITTHTTEVIQAYANADGKTTAEDFEAFRMDAYGPFYNGVEEDLYNAGH